MPSGAPMRCQEREWTGEPSECQSADAGAVRSCILNPRHLLVIHHTLPPPSQEFESTALTGSHSLAHIGESFSSSFPLPPYPACWWCIPAAFPWGKVRVEGWRAHSVTARERGEGTASRLKYLDRCSSSAMAPPPQLASQVWRITHMLLD